MSKKVSGVAELPTEEVMRARVAALTPEEAGAAWLRLEMARGYLQRYRDALESYVRQAGEEHHRKA